jgi:hypothetical protein
MGGLGVGAVAIGGVAAGVVAAGGVAFGYFACGGTAFGTYVLSGLIQDPEAIHFFGRWIPGLEAWAPPPGG